MTRHGSVRRLALALDDPGDAMNTFELAVATGVIFGVAILILLWTGSASIQERMRMRNVDKLVAQYGEVSTSANEVARSAIYDSRAIGSLERWLAERFFSANLRGQPNSWLAGSLIIAFGLLLVLLFLGVAPVASILLAPILSIGGLYAGIEFRSQKLRGEFQTELAEGLLILASSLRAGLNFNQALDALATQSPGELGRQFRRALIEVQLGSEMEPALSRVAERTRSSDLDWLVIALDVQREVGGPLAKILDGVAGTIKSRASVRLEANSLAAEGKLSSYVLIALPIGILLFLAAAQPEYIAPLFGSPIGLAMVSVMGLLMLVGWVWLKKITAIKL